MDDPELENWRKYLDFEESEGDYRRTAFLYERCLVPTALYEEFWLRYARWMLGQNKGYTANKEDFANNSDEDTRLIYMRASCIFVPLGLPTIRLHWARFEEKLKRFDMAHDIHTGIIETLPQNTEAYISLINMERRHSGNEAAIKMCQHYQNNCPPSFACHLLVEQARILWECAGDVDGARALYRRFHPIFLNSTTFWTGFLKFECSQPRNAKAGSQSGVKNAYDLMLATGNLKPIEREELSSIYMNDLLARGDDQAAAEYIRTDKNLHQRYEDGHGRNVSTQG